VFDLLFAGQLDLRALPLEQRKNRLEFFLDKQSKRGDPLHFVSHLAAPGRSVLEAACRMGLEGIISKRLGAAYVSGRIDTWAKSKCRGGQEVVIGGWRGTQDKLRSLLVGTFENGKLVYRGRVGTGFPADVASDLIIRLRPLRVAKPAFSNPPKERDLLWVEPKLVGEIEYEDITSDGIFRQAAFKGLRLDKPAKSVVIERPTSTARAEKEASMDVRTKPPGPRGLLNTGKGPAVLGITITNPDKVLWPATADSKAVTKLDLARYYEAFAERILLHIANRPISIVRAPDGIGGEQFFQRHKLMGTAVPMLALKVRSEKQPYLGIADAKALVALAQAGVLEIHPWGSKPGDPDTPEIIIFDLDPAEGLPFDRVVQSAKDLKARLEALGFTPFVKTTGGKGLHVVIAVKGSAKKPLTWPDAKTFARAIALQLEREEPDRYTSTVAKKARTGKIFVDYLRNDRTSTGVAPWSPRARPRATIAVPLAWSLLKAGLDPQAFTIPSSRALLKRADPWKGLAASAAPLEPAMKKVIK
jgi:bifunctional non-homologous end joining protein LigD